MKDIIYCEKGHPRNSTIHPSSCPACKRGAPDFNGAEYSRKHDQKRLTGQILRVFEAIKDGKWRTLDEIAQITNDPHASISAQLRNLRKERFGSHVIERQARGDRSSGLFEYRLGESDQ